MGCSLLRDWMSSSSRVSLHEILGANLAATPWCNWLFELECLNFLFEYSNSLVALLTRWNRF